MARYTVVGPVNIVLKGKTKREYSTYTAAGAPTPPGDSLPTAQTGVLVPYVLGRKRITAPNCIWYGNLQPKTRTTTSSYTILEPRQQGNFTIYDTIERILTRIEIIGYTIDLALGICLGDNVRLRAVYADNAKIWEGDVGPAGTDITLGGETFAGSSARFYGGQFNQAPDAHMTANTTAAQPGYVGIAYILLKGVEAQNGFGKLSFEVERFPDPLALGAENRIGDDLNLATALYELITSPWGGGGISASALDFASFVAAGAILFDEANGASLLNAVEAPVKALVDALREQALGTIFENPETGLISFKLTRQELFDLPSVPRFGPSDITLFQNYSKGAWSQALSKVRVTYTDRAASYKVGAVGAQNLASLSDAGRAGLSTTLDYPTVHDGTLATKLASRELVRNGIPRFAATIETKRIGASLLPGDAIVLDWPDYGIEGLPCLVTKRRAQPVENGRVTLELEQLSFPTGNALFVPPLPSLAEGADTEIVAPLSATFYEAPYWVTQQLCGTTPYDDYYFRNILAFVERGNSRQVGVNGWQDNKRGTSLGGTIYTYQTQVIPANPGNTLGTVSSGARRDDYASYTAIGELADAIGLYDGVATGELTSITLINFQNAFPLLSIGEAGVRQGQHFLYIDDEILSFETVTNAGANVWVFGGIHRALLDTAPQAHAENARCFVTPPEFLHYVANGLFPFDDPYVATWRFVSASVKTIGTVDNAFPLVVSAIPPITERAGKPYRPHNFRISGSARSGTPVAFACGVSKTFNWNPRSRIPSAVALTLDAPEVMEEVSAGVFPVFNVKLQDSLGVIHTLGTTADTSTADTLTVTPPTTIENGPATVWAEAVNPVGASLYQDRLPVTVTGGSTGGVTDTYGSHSYWRVRRLASTNPNFVSIAELVFGPNVMTGGTPFANSQFSSTFSPDKAFDGGPATAWSTATNIVTNAFLAYQFASPVIVNSVTVTAPDGTGTTGGEQCPTQFAVEYSDNGTAWTLAWTVTTTAWAELETRTFNSP